MPNAKHICPGCEELTVPGTSKRQGTFIQGPFIDAQERSWHLACAERALASSFRTPLAPEDATAAIRNEEQNVDQKEAVERAKAFKFYYAALHGGEMPTQEDFVREIKLLGILDWKQDAFERWLEGMKDDIAKRVRRAEALSEKELAIRFLTAIYDLADGRTDVEVNAEEARKHANRIGLKLMTDDEFVAYHKRIMDRVKALRQEASKQPS